MQRHEIRLCQERVEGFDLTRGTQGHEIDDVVEEDTHAKRFCQYRKLGADVAVADNTKSLAANLSAAFRLLVPQTVTHLEAALEILARERDDFGNDKLCDGARVGEW